MGKARVIQKRRPRLPWAAHLMSPTPMQLAEAHAWHAGASDEAKAAYRQARMGIISAHSTSSQRPPCVLMNTAGSTGISKAYTWGPNFEAMDRFFHKLVFNGSVLSTATLTVKEVGSGKCSVSVIPTPGFYAYQKQVVVTVGECNQESIMDTLKKELSCCNVISSSSFVNALKGVANLEEAMTRGSILALTGEPFDYEIERRMPKVRVVDQMRCWDGGATFYTCGYGGRHWVEAVAEVHVDGDELVSTDLFNISQPHIAYRNGDRVKMHQGGRCACGHMLWNITFVNREHIPRVTCPNGGKVTYLDLKGAAHTACFHSKVGTLHEIRFGVGSPGDLLIEYYIMKADDGDLDKFEQAMRNVLHVNMGFTSPRFRRQAVSYGHRKAQRIFNLREDQNGGAERKGEDINC